MSGGTLSMGRYRDFRELRRSEREGLDYRILWHPGLTGIVVMAPHGGGIEPGTTELAAAIAGRDHAFYSFCGLKRRRNLDLHLPSHVFDEPRGLTGACRHRLVLTVHGCRGEEERIHVGGLEERIGLALRRGLAEAGFAVQFGTCFPGRHPLNLCNRGGSRRGVQLELSAGLRKALCSQAAPFERLVGVVRSRLATWLDGLPPRRETTPGRAGKYSRRTHA